MCNSNTLGLIFHPPITRLPEEDTLSTDTSWLTAQQCLFDIQKCFLAEKKNCVVSRNNYLFPPPSQERWKANLPCWDELQ